MGLPGHVSHTLEGQHSLQAGRAAPYLLTDLETALCLYRAWQVSPLMGAWT